MSDVPVSRRSLSPHFDDSQIVKDKNDFYRRYRIRIVQEAFIEVDIMGEEDDVVRLMADRLMNESMRDPKGWKSKFERMFPAMTTSARHIASIDDIGPARAKPFEEERRAIEAADDDIVDAEIVE